MVSSPCISPSKETLWMVLSLVDPIIPPMVLCPSIIPSTVTFCIVTLAPPASPPTPQLPLIFTFSIMRSCIEPP